jgi:hypothetical protein
MKRNIVEIPKKVHYPDMNAYGTISFARTKKDLDREIYETLDLPEWLKDCIENYANRRAVDELKQFKKCIKSLFN